jgi:MFS family permease
VVASTHTIGTESVPEHWRGLMSGLIGGGGAGLGALLASIAFLFTASVFPGPAFAEWGWRVMFFFGILSAALGLFVFNKLEESPLWKQLDEARSRGAAQDAPVERSPLRTLFSQAHRPVLLVNLLITFGGGAGYYLTSGYMPTFLKVVNGVPNAASSMILMAASVTAIVSATLTGHISEMIGRKKTFLLVGVLCLVLLPVCYIGMASASDVPTVLAYALGITFLGNAGYAPILIFLNERFPTALRASGTGLSWNIGFALGGTMPTFVSLASGTTQGIPMALAAFTAVIFLLYLIGAAVVPETRGRLA